MELQTERSATTFTTESRCLIVEPSLPFALVLQACMEQQGIPRNHITICRRYEDAKKHIEKNPPAILVTEYDLSVGMGLTLIEMQEEMFPENKRVSIVVTGNSADSAIAEAAEGAVDAYILKPFSPELFRKKVAEVLDKKNNPSKYMQWVQSGRTHAKQGEWNEALTFYEEAKHLDQKPSLASYLAGEVYQKQGLWSQALEEYQKGRQFFPLHYKCLMGEFEVLMEQKKYTDAYKLVPIISRNYPLTSQRLGLIFIAAVYTYHFDDLPEYYSLFLRTEHRTERLVKLTSMALFVAGKYFLQQKNPEQALLYFDMSLTAQQRSMALTESVVKELLAAGAVEQADLIFNKTMPSDFGTPLHSQLRFKIDRYRLAPDKVVDQGRKMIAAGLATPEICHMIIEVLAQMGKETLAESFISRMLEIYPNLKEPLYQTLRKNLI